MGNLRAPLPVRIIEVTGAGRAGLRPIIEQSFRGIYRWHALRTLADVHRVRASSEGNLVMGLAMFTMLQPGMGYLYYVAVIPSRRGTGLGGVLLDNALSELRAEGAGEVLACIRRDNAASIRLFASRGFARERFREVVRSRGLAGAAKLWRRMVVAPGERVFRKPM